MLPASCRRPAPTAVPLQGLASYTKDRTYDTQLFALTVLLSSFFIYNSLGSIDEVALDRLSCVAQCAGQPGLR